jgi:protein-disulfide isomerase
LQTGPLLDEAYVATGKVKHVFLQFPMDSLHPNARPAAEACMCAAKQSLKAFWAMHDRLFETGSDWGREADPSKWFKEYAAELDLDAAAFAACVDNRETAADVQAQVDRGLAAGVGGTPAFFVNEWFVSGAQPYENFQDVIERALRGERPPPTPTPLPEGATPFDANPERPGYTYDGDAFTGSADAQLALVGFIDFGSEANSTHLKDVWPDIQKEYVDTGVVRYIVKHFPAPDQVASFQAATAAECAGQQGGFWDLHDVLFEKQAEWTKADDVLDVLHGYVAELGLDADGFQTCLDEAAMEEAVNRDLNIAVQNNFPPAPQFFVFKGSSGGYAPADQLAATIEELLAR